MRYALISDVHVEGGPDDPVQPALVRWLDRVNADAVFVLGDLFHAWWGYRDVVPARLVPTCAALQRLVGRGVALHVVPGNHDFALGPFFTRVLQAGVHGPHVRSLDGVRFLLAHGDEADATLGYRLTRLGLRSRPFAAGMRALGPALGWRVVSALAGSSRHHPADPLRLRLLQQQWARPFLEASADYAVMGHIHAPGLSPDGRVIHLGGWGTDRTWCLVDGGVPRLVVGDATDRPRPPAGR